MAMIVQILRPFSNFTRGHTAHNRIRRDILCYNSACTHHCTFAYVHAFQNRTTYAQPSVVGNCYGFKYAFKTTTTHIMTARHNIYLMGNRNAIANSNACTGIQRTTTVYMASLTDFYMPRSHKIGALHHKRAFAYSHT